MLLLLKPYLICFNLSHTFDPIFPIAKKKNEERMSTFLQEQAGGHFTNILNCPLCTISSLNSISILNGDLVH